MFTIYDRFGDGIVSAGNYKVRCDNQLVNQGGNVGSQDCVTFGGTCSTP